MTTPPMMSQDLVFRRALLALPQPPQEALAEAELDDPGLLRAYPRSSAAQLGIGDHAPSSDLRRRFTKKGGGGGGMADAVAELGTAVDTDTGNFTGVATTEDGMSGGTGTTAGGGTMGLLCISSSVVVVSAGALPEEGPETLALRTGGVCLESKATVESTSPDEVLEGSPSGGKIETEKCAPVGKWRESENRKVCHSDGKCREEEKGQRGSVEVENRVFWEGQNSGFCVEFAERAKLKKCGRS